MRYRYRSDDELKDSGVEWIGKIPKDWTVSRIKWLIANKITDGPHETPEFIDSGIPFLSVDAIQDGKLVFDNSRYISYEDHTRYIKKCRPQRNDILMGKAASTGKIAIVDTDIEFSIWSPLALIRPLKNIKPRYLEFSMKSSQTQYEIDLLCTNNTQKNISMDDIAKLKVIYPNLKEQEKIVTFLTEKALKFDSIISKKEKLIERLEEAKKSLISEVVTGKVKVVKNDDGYDLVKRNNEEMKDSGVEWLGEIPKDWEVKKLKYITDVKGRIGFRGYTKEDLVDEGMGALAIGASQISSKGMLDLSSPTYISWEKYFESPEIMLNNDDILLVQRGSTTGKIGIVESLLEKSTINPSLVIIKKPKHTFAKYLFYYLKSRFIESHFNSITSSTAIPMISQEQVLNIFICTPIKEEQEIIYNLLDIKSNEIDETTDKIKLQIEKLKEAKQSLISEAVTGKVEIL